MRTVGSTWICSLLAVSVLCLAGCKKAAEPEKAAAPAVPRHKEALALHWLGKARLDAETNAAYFVNLWNLPESQTFQNVALDKLTAFVSASSGNSDPMLTNALNALTRPLFDDLLKQESISRVWVTTNGHTEAGMAVRLPGERSISWRNNLAAALEAATSKKTAAATNGGWRIDVGNENSVEFQTNTEWTFIAFGPQNREMLSNLKAEALSPKTSASTSATNYWVEGTLNLDLLAKLAGKPAGSSDALPTVHLLAFGDGEYVRTRAKLDFPKPLDLELGTWHIPTNWVREPLITFTALRGVRPWLERLGWVRDLQLSNVGNEFFAWALSSSYVHSFQAMPLTNAVADMDRLGPGIVRKINSWLTNQAVGSVRFSKEYHGMVWMPVPMFTPALLAVDDPNGGLLLGSLCGAQPPPGDPGPAELFGRVTGTTNLVYYDWEITEARVRHWIALGQSARLAFYRAQLPIDGMGVKFLTAVAGKLGNTATEITASSPSSLDFVRKSHCGLTGFELHLLADWVESPTFPVGLHTLDAEGTPVLRYRAATRTFEPVTNSPPKPK